MGKTKGEVTKWRLLPTNQIDKGKYTEIMKSLAAFMRSTEKTECELPPESIMLEGAIPIDEEYCNCVRTSWLKKVKKDDRMFYAETKSGSIYEFHPSHMDWLMVFTFGEIAQFGDIEIWYPNKVRF